MNKEEKGKRRWGGDIRRTREEGVKEELKKCSEEKKINKERREENHLSYERKDETRKRYLKKLIGTK